MKIVKNYKIWFALSLVIILAGVVMMVTSGLNYGIDFTGGTMLTLPTGKVIPAKDVTKALESFDLNPVVQHSGQNDETIVIKTTKSLDTEKRNEIRDKLIKTFSLPKGLKMDGEQFGPNVGEEITRKALISMGLAALGVLIYITVRFQFYYGLAAIIALVHDMAVLVSIYAFFNVTVNSNFIAAILTILGYSINDTIVVFDRIRENAKYMRGTPKLEIAGRSVNQSISRTVMTSLTTFSVIFFLYILGVPTVKEFALPLMFGVIVGTYSSICLAGPLWALLSKEK